MNESLSIRNQFWATVVKELRDQLAVKDARIKELDELVWWWKEEAERLSIALEAAKKGEKS